MRVSIRRGPRKAEFSLDPAVQRLARGGADLPLPDDHRRRGEEPVRHGVRQHPSRVGDALGYAVPIQARERVFSARWRRHGGDDSRGMGRRMRRGPVAARGDRGT